MARQRAVASGSFAEALLQEGRGSPDAAARALARRSGLPLVDLNDVGTSFEATEAMPLPVLQRAVALPYAIQDDRLRIAIADPRDLNAIDELRLASRMAIELAVAPRDNILMELKRLSRASEMYGARDAVEATVDEAVDEDELSRPEINIITVKDPVEFRLLGANQVQINARAGLTFATALRSILRSDPDVVMVGEIRDGETAKISIEAELTGHFVLSTMHTNDAPSAITRLTEMGVEPFVTGSALTGVLAQRLARRLCTHCCEMYTPSKEELAHARVSRLTRNWLGWSLTMRPDDGPTGVAASQTASSAKDLKVSAKEPAVVGAVVRVVVRMTDGDHVLAGTFPDAQQAYELAKELQEWFGQSDGVWPLVDGRYLRTQAVVSIDLVEEEHRRWGGSADRAKVKGLQPRG